MDSPYFFVMMLKNMSSKNNGVEIANLTSGAKFISVQNDLPLSTVSVWFRAGSRRDPAGKEGLAHFFEHLLITKTQKYPDRQQLLRAVAREGMRYNATTARDGVWYYYEQPTEKTDKALDFLIEGLNSSFFLKEDVEREKGTILDELSRRDSNPASFLNHFSHTALWPSASLGRSNLGTAESLKRITFDDLQSFYKDHYNSDNVVFVVVGKHNAREAKDVIERNYGRRSQGSPRQLPERLGLPETVKVDHRPMNQVLTAINFRTTAEKNHGDAVALDLAASYYIANTWVSQLIKKMRLESDLTYWVNGNSITYSDTGFVTFVFSTAPEKYNAALRVVLQEIDRLKSGDISKEDFEGSKAIARASFLRNSLNPRDVLEWYGWQGLVGERIYSLEEYLTDMTALTPGDIQQVTQKYFIKENLAVALIGPVKRENVVLGWS